MPDARGIHRIDAAEAAVNSCIQDERAFWSRPADQSFPAAQVARCCQFLHGVFSAERAETQQALEAVQSWSSLATMQRERPRAPANIKTYFNLESAVFETQWLLREQELKAEQLRARSRFRQRRGASQTEIDNVVAAVETARAEVRGRATALHVEKRRLKALVTDHYPELAMRFPDADLIGVADLEGLVRPGITFESYNIGPKTKTITKGRSKVFVTSFGGNRCVLKQFQLADRNKFQVEAKRLRKLKHPHVAQITAVVFHAHNSCVGGGESAYIEMPLYLGGDMAEWLDTHKPQPPQRQVVLHQVCRGLEYLHTEGVLHCDIKLENILMDVDSPTARPVIADFDISKDAEQRAMATQTATGIHGTLQYMAPEVLPAAAGGKSQRQTKESDVYSFGVVCLLTFSESGRRDPTCAARASAVEQLLDKDTPEALVVLLQSLLHNESTERPTLATVLTHPALAIDLVAHQLTALAKAAELEAQLQRHTLEAERAQMRAEAEQRQRETAKRAHALLRECCICFDKLPKNEGVECTERVNVQRHFVCSDCFSSYVETESGTDDQADLTRRGGCIFCPNKKYGCSKSIAYADADVARHASAKAFAKYLGGKRKLLETRLSEEIEATERARFEGELQHLEQMDEQQRKVHQHTRALVEAVNLKCPQGHVFNLPPDWDFQSECLALTCTRAGCESRFCGWCQQDCGRDAHAHVAQCASKPAAADPFFSTREEWECHERARMSAVVTTYLDEIEDATTRGKVALAQVVLDLGIDPTPYIDD
jgi:serine/threonine protein kinase